MITGRESVTDKTFEEFPTGKRVRLRSGGPVMTVGMVVDYHAAVATWRDIGVECTWADSDSRLHRATFLPAMLEDVVP